MAWRGGRRGTAGVAVLCAATWLASNVLAGMATSPAILAFNTSALLASFVLVGLLMASLRRAQLREHHLSRTDALTELLNSRGFYRQAEQALENARRHQRPLTVAYLDLDSFKAVGNDRLGHAAGDQVLQQVSAILRASVRAGDEVARLGGDEFGLLMPETSAEGARAVLERIRARVEALDLAQGCRIGASIGAVGFSDIPATVEDALRVADARMYEVKMSGKNRVLVADVAPGSGAT